MTIRNLNYFFTPRSIAVIGEGTGAGSPDARLVRNLVNGGFNGPVMPVNRKQDAVQGVLAYRDVASLPSAADLAIVTLRPSAAPAVIHDLARRGTRAVMLLNDFPGGPSGDVDPGDWQSILDAAKPYLLRIMGPDRLGIAVPHYRLNATLTTLTAHEGHIALVSQSSAVTRGVMDWAASNAIGFSHVVSLGAKLDVDIGDLLDYLALDIRSRSILLYLEEVRNARKFMSAARIAARIKPVIILKPRPCNSSRIDDAVYDTAFRRAGILRVNTIDQLFGAVETLADAKPVHSNRLAIVSNSRSLALLACDTLIRTGGALATFSDATIEALRQSLPAGLGAANPVNLGEHASPETYATTLNLTLNDPGAGGTLVVHSPVGHDWDLACAHAVIEQVRSSPRFVQTCWIGAASAEPSRRLFKETRVATYRSMKDAARAFVGVALYRHNQQLLMQTPPSVPQEFTPDVDVARAVIDATLAAGRGRLNDFESMRVLSAFEIPILDTRLARSPEEAQAISLELGGRVTMNILTSGGRVDQDAADAAVILEGPAEVYDAATAMVSQTQESSVLIEGLLLQPVQRVFGAYQLSVGIVFVPPFGPVLRFGHGGPEADVIDDHAYALPPLNMQLARDIISRTRVHARLDSGQGVPGTIDDVAVILIKVSQLAIDLPEIVGLDIDLLWDSETAAVACHAEIRVSQCLGDVSRRLAIRPYPKELEHSLKLSSGRALQIRPIRPEDEPALQAMVGRVPAEDRRLRFFQPIKELSHAMAARLTQIDYDREMALLVTEPGSPGQVDILGVVRFSADPDMERAEYAIILDSSMHGQGLGLLLMRQIIAYARSRGIKEIFGEVLKENEAMLKLNRALGFEIELQPDDPGVMHVTLCLGETDAIGG